MGMVNASYGRTALQEPWSYWLAKLAASTLPLPMSAQTAAPTREHPRIELPNGMVVAWYGGGLQQVSRVKTLGMGGLFISATIVRPVGTTLTLVFQVPGGVINAEAVVRHVVADEGMGVQFTKMGETDRALLKDLLTRLLR